MFGNSAAVTRAAMIKFQLRAQSTTNVIKSIGKISFPKTSEDPQLILNLLQPAPSMSPADMVISLKPWYTISHLKQIIRKEECVFELKSILTKPVADIKATDVVMAKYANETTLAEVIKSALKQEERALYLQLKFPPHRQPMVLNSATLTSAAGGANEKHEEKLLLARFDLQSFEDRIADYKAEEAQLLEDITPLQLLKDNCDQKALSHSNRLVWGGLIALFAEWTILARLTWDYSWDVMEPITWFIGMGNTISAYVFYVIYRKDFTCEVLSSMTATKKQLALYKKRGLDIDLYMKKSTRIQAVQADIQRIAAEYPLKQ